MRSEPRNRAVGGALGAMLGMGFGTMGLIKTRAGFEISGATENSYAVAAGVAILGAAVGAFILSRRPLTLVGAIVGLGLGIWLRDNADNFGTVQAPKVFLLLFGLPLLFGWAGWHLGRRRQTEHDHRPAAAPLEDLPRTSRK